MKTSTTRRAVLGALAAAPVTAMPAIGDTGNLHTLIAALKQAQEAVVVAGADLSRLEAEWMKIERKPFLVPCFLGEAMESGRGDADCREWIADSYSRARKSLGPLARIAPEQADQMRQTLDVKEAENLALVDKLFAEEAERREAFGFGPAERRYEEVLDAEQTAALALCSYQCHSIEEARIKAAAIVESEVLDDFDKRFAMAFVQSFADASS